MTISRIIYSSACFSANVRVRLFFIFLRKSKMGYSWNYGGFYDSQHNTALKTTAFCFVIAINIDFKGT